MKMNIPYPEKQKIELGELCFLLLNIPVGVKYNSNVFCFNNRNKLLWQISDDIVAKYTKDDSPFVNMDVSNDQNLVLYNWGGWKITVDPKTGEELSYEFTK